MMESGSQSPQPPSPPPPQPQGTGGGLGRWLGRKTNLGFIFVATIAIAVVLYRIVWGLSPIISGDVFGLLAILLFLIIMELADIKAILALLVLGLWAILLFYGSKIIDDGNLLNIVLTGVGALVLTVVGFYFGSRASQEKGS